MTNPAKPRPMSSRIKKGTQAGAAALVLVGGFEGVRQNAYPDPATHGAPWTICYGHTEGVHRGDVHTMEECKDMLYQDNAEYAAGVEACLHVPVPDSRLIALTSFAINIGVGGACKSRVVALINAGKPHEGCAALLGYNHAIGIVFPGLTRRRERERVFCDKA